MKNWLEYIVEHNPNGVSKVLVNEGFPPAHDLETLYMYAEEYAVSGESAYEALMSQHPDLQDIKALIQRFTEQSKKRTPLYQEFVSSGAFGSFAEKAFTLPISQEPMNELSKNKAADGVEKGTIQFVHQPLGQKDWLFIGATVVLTAIFTQIFKY